MNQGALRENSLDKRQTAPGALAIVIKMIVPLIVVMIAPLLFSILIGCSDSKPGNTAQNPPPANVMNVQKALEASQVVSMGNVAASGTVDVSLDEDDGSLSGSVTVNGMNAQSVSLNVGYAGARGPVLLELESAGAGQWSIPAVSVLGETDRDRFNSGQLYVLVTSGDFPEGALRAQLLTENITLLRTVLSGAQMVPSVDSMASGIGFVTVNASDSSFAVNINTQGADDAIAAHIHMALAGLNGGILFDLVQDPNDPAHWLAEGLNFAAEDIEALAAGAFYYVVHTPAFPAGLLRGQIVPAGLAIVFTLLTGADVVVPGMMGVVTDATAYAATTTNPATRAVTVHLNTEMLADATAASINIAPAGQNGSVLVELQQDLDNSAHWFGENLVLTTDDETALLNQSLYLQVSNTEFPAGLIRGQWLPEHSMQGSGDTFTVAAIEPMAGAEITGFPAVISIVFSATVSAASITAAQLQLLASGSDGSFSEGNETAVTPLLLSNSGANLAIDTSSATGTDDTYQLTLLGTGDSPITDAFGNVLDGDANGEPGGDFTSIFNVMADMPAVTFSFIQDSIFTPNCANAGCHSGASPTAGQNLAAGQAFANIVGIASTEVPALSRIEPGEPDNSYLVQKLEGTAQVGGRMPLGAPALPNELVQALRQWINDGALNN